MIIKVIIKMDINIVLLIYLFSNFMAQKFLGDLCVFLIFLIVMKVSNLVKSLI